ncbi:MAG: glycosyltransferase family 4 protein [Hyphomicrobium sp.]
MRIALTADPELPVPPLLYGGIERVVDLLARNLASRGHEVRLFAHPQSTCTVPKVAWPGVRSASGVDSLRNAALLARHVATDRYDVVHSFSRVAYLGPILPWPIPKLMTYQREISPNTTSKANALAVGSLRFTALSQQMLTRAKLHGHWSIVPNGVSLGTYGFRPDVAPDAPLVFLGRIEEIKGPHLAIAAARRVGRQLVLAGNVPEEHLGWFESNVAPHIDGRDVCYLGPVDDVRKNDLLGRASALLMPILWEEPFGIVMIEAMACGTPVIGLRRGAVPEVVAHGVTGFVVDTDDEMAEAIAKLPAIHRAACRQRVATHYSDDAMTEAYLSLYLQMIENRRGPRRAGEERSPLAARR